MGEETKPAQIPTKPRYVGLSPKVIIAIVVVIILAVIGLSVMAYLSIKEAEECTANPLGYASKNYYEYDGVTKIVNDNATFTCRFQGQEYRILKNGTFDKVDYYNIPLSDFQLK